MAGAKAFDTGEKVIIRKGSGSLIPTANPSAAFGQQEVRRQGSQDDEVIGGQPQRRTLQGRK